MRAGVRALALAAALWACAGSTHAADAVFTYTAVQGDTLIGLGKRFLIEPARWSELTRANALRNPNRIATGTPIRIPLRLMRTEAVPATLLSVVGEATDSGAGALKAGQTVPEGGVVSTGPEGHVTLRLVDGTVLRLRPASRLQVNESRRFKDADAVQSGARLERGRVEIEAAPAAAGRPGFKIDTPQGVLGVRGTEFRVATDTAQGITLGEVLGGAVAFDGRGSSERVTAGHGTAISAAGQVAPPVALLDAPDVSGLPQLQERLLMRFTLPAMPSASAYRGQIARDASFDAVLADLTGPTPELRFAELPDGDYLLRVRAIDARGLEGRDADHRFRLKARPEAPLPSAPAPKAVVFGGRVELAWAANQEAQTYRLQLARGDADFTRPLHDLRGLRSLATTLEGLLPGGYHWRLASVRADGDMGPWGTARSFDMRPLPPDIKPPKVGDRGISFAWDGAPGQTFEFQLARDAAFNNKIIDRQLDRPALEMPLPGTGRFYLRLRARDADGFVGPYTTPQYVDVPNCLRDGSGACVRASDQTLNLAP